MFKGVKKDKSTREGFLGQLNRIAQDVLSNVAEREKFRRLQKIIEKAWGGRSVDEIEPFSVGGYGSDLYKAHLSIIVRNLKDDFEEIDRFFSELAERQELWATFFDIPQDKLGGFLGRSLRGEEDPGRRRELLIAALAERAGGDTVSADSLGQAGETLWISAEVKSGLSPEDLETCRILFGEDFDSARIGEFLSAHHGDADLLMNQVLIPAMERRFDEVQAGFDGILEKLRGPTDMGLDGNPAVDEVLSGVFDIKLDLLRDLLLDNGISREEADSAIGGLRREVRAFVMKAADVPEEMTDSVLTENLADVDRSVVERFRALLNEAVRGLHSEAGGGMVLVTDVPEDAEDEEALLGALLKFPGRIERLEVLIKGRQSINRKRWNFTRLVTQNMNRAKPEKVLERILKRESSGKGIAFLFTAATVSPEFREKINSVFAEVEKIGSKEMKDLALTATLLLLFKLSRLTPEERSRVVERTEVLNAFLEDAGLGFLKGKFGANAGSLELLASDFMQSFAAEQAVERAA